ncbi:hypothetical protein N7448_002327 [Penicillium atrosanguineum]|uniref:uncharacterized protein n=1 Tax=Penicillium atrosanguineum TaxID=1132637 RepID=UPI002383A203|nr:uncharacterized protein N7443_005731 [Penicillium atrosanguineum]KAJ5144935.1 hypothetical protein N7448_002327 [Penicillium atrosanguineum]KAJ5300729.1 hypothetical protein N7443_005731 [Penicillium atrosanguineum]
MMMALGLLGVLLTPPVLGQVHHFYSGFMSGDSLYGVEFNEQSSALSVFYNGTLNVSSSKWIATDISQKNVYIADGDNVNYIVSADTAPFTVFGAPYSAGCPGQVISVGSSGTLESVEANISYSSDSGVHGLALSADSRFIYSGDDMGGSIWTHSYNEATNTVTKLQRLNVSGNPRHLVVSPQASFVYVILEENNQLAVFNRDSTSGLLTGRNKTLSLLPTGTTRILFGRQVQSDANHSHFYSAYSNSSLYWSDEVKFSNPQEEGKYPKYLFATIRSRTSTDPGFVAAFALDSTTGSINNRLFLIPTTASGGASNSISPAIFSEEYFTISDAQNNFIEVWKLGEDAQTATSIAHLDVADSPANVVWVN